MLYQNGLVSSLPFLAKFLVSQAVGLLADYLQNQSALSVTTVRKVFNSIGKYSMNMVSWFGYAG